MSRQVRWIAIAAGAVIALTACSSGEKEAESSASPSTTTATTIAPSPTPTSSEESSAAVTDVVKGVPNFEYLSHCDALRCSLPVNPTTKVLDGYAITDDNWPLEPSDEHSDDGDSMIIICALEGDWIQDDRDAAFNSNLWYKVIVPKEKLVIVDDHHRGLTTDDLEKTPDGDYYGYVSSVWVLLQEDLVPPSC